MIPQLKLVLMLLFGVSFLSVASLLVASNDEHEGHDHGSHHVDVQDSRISADNKTHTDHSGHDRGQGREKDEEHEQHSGHDHGDTHEDHAGHGHKGEGHSEHSDEITLTEEAIRLFKLRIETARRQKLIRKISAPARVTFNIEGLAHVGSSVSGRVKEIRFRIGDYVKKGDVLLVVDSPELGSLQSEFLQKRIEVQVAEISLEVARTEYERARKLIEGKGISQAQFLQAQGKYKIAEGALLTAKSAAQALKNRLHLFGMTQKRVEELIKNEEIDSAYTISAPISGEIIAREVTIGKVVNPDDDALMTIADLSTLWVIASVPDVQMRFIKVGASATITSETIGNNHAGGKVSYIAPALDERTRTGQIRIEISNGHNVLRPGMFGTAMIDETKDNMDSSPNVLAVPESAVYTVEGSPAVFVVREDEKNTFEKRAVTIGPVISGYVTVLSGLEEGERYVANGGFILKAELGKEGVAHEH